MTSTLLPDGILQRLREPDTTVDDLIEFGHNTGRWTALEVGQAIRDNGLEVDDYGHAVPRPGSDAGTHLRPEAAIKLGLDHAAATVRRAAAQAETALERLAGALLAEHDRDRVRAQLDALAEQRAKLDAERDRLRSQLRPNGKPTAGKTPKSADRPIEHGTRRGWFQHRKRQQWPPCADCAAAYKDAKTAPPAA